MDFAIPTLFLVIVYFMTGAALPACRLLAAPSRA